MTIPASRDRTVVVKALHLIENAGLLVVLIATIVAVVQEVLVIIGKGHVDLADLLLLFIYLEVLAMVGIYFESHRLPVRFVLYIAMVAVARFIILDMKEMTPLELVAAAGAMVLIAASILIVRYGHVRFPYNE